VGTSNPGIAGRSLATYQFAFPGIGKGLNVFCTQNGWIDNESLWFEIRESANDDVVVAVGFVEVIMEESGCVANRRECFGKLRLFLASDGPVKSAKVI